MNRNNVTKTKVVTGMVWKLLERFSVQGISFIIGIVLARLLEPEHYGIIAIEMIFIALANSIVQSGFSTALIQKAKVSELELSSVFYVNLMIAAVLYVAIYFFSPLITAYYEMPELLHVLRVLALVLPFGALSSIQNAIIARELMFRRLFFSSIGASAISGGVGIYLAYAGFGVWALVAQQLVSNVVTCTLLLILIRWYPKWMLSIKCLRPLWTFGWKMLLGGIFYTLYNDLQSLVIGKAFSASTLGYYDRGKQFPMAIGANVDGAIQSVLLPTYAAYQSDKQRVKELMRRAIKTSSFLMFPIMIGLAVIAESMVTILLTEKWLACVPILQIYCVYFILLPIASANVQAIYAIGRSDVGLIIEVIKKTIGVAILCVAAFILKSVTAIAFGMLLTGFLSMVINVFPNKRLLGYSYLELLKDISPPFIAAIIMGALVWVVGLTEINIFAKLICQIVIGTGIYVGLSKLTNHESFKYLRASLKDLGKK